MAIELSANGLAAVRRQTYQFVEALASGIAHHGSGGREEAVLEHGMMHFISKGAANISWGTSDAVYRQVPELVDALNGVVVRAGKDDMRGALESAHDAHKLVQSAMKEHGWQDVHENIWPLHH